jgi:hypothetical protein
MPQPDPNAPESIILGQFSGLKNTVAAERLSGSDLQRAINVDIDDAGQLRRRRGFTQKDSSKWHSIKAMAGKVYGVKNGVLGIIRPNYAFYTLGVTIGDPPVCYTEVNDEVYFSSRDASGVITLNETVTDWGTTNGQGTWLSPVYTPTDTLGEVSGRLMGDPPKATQIEAYRGRIYLAVGKTLWATELYSYHYVDRTKNFMPFEHNITLVMSVDDGLYVGTDGGLYFLQGTLATFKLSQVSEAAVLPGSGVFVPANLVHPQARNQEVPTGIAVVCMTSAGIVAGFDGGTVYNLTQGRVEFPGGIRAAGLFRQDVGDNSYVAAVDSAGGPAANARIGDYLDAEIVQAFDRARLSGSIGVGDSVSATIV